ncbi:MAG: hypothetical protein L0K48_03180 [Bifidobacterium mongoliense]|nr:hypothetical protein [Bifidobacterium mongoliense]
MELLNHKGLLLVCTLLSFGAFIATLAGVGNGLYRLNGTLRDAAGGDAAGIMLDVQRMVSSVSVYFIWSLVFLVVTVAFTLVTVRATRAQPV